MGVIRLQSKEIGNSMNKRRFAMLILFWLGCFVSESPAQDIVPQWVSEGPSIEGRSASFEVPLMILGTKLYVDVEIGGKLRRFVVDTGSPSMIDKALVNELGLDTVGTGHGRDAHGVIVESHIVQASIKIGGVSFHKVPMFSAPFSASAATKIFIGDGVLGSELLPLGVWQVDLRNSVLRFNTEASGLPFIKESQPAKLYSFGYPHAPILDVQFATRARSKAMLDTGSPTYFAISPDDYAGTAKAGGIGKKASGYGSLGGSLGGQAPDGDQLQVELKNLSLGKVPFGRVEAIRRESSPSLIGAKILEHFIVTLDSKSRTAYFFQFNNRMLAQTSFGFSLAFIEGISVALVWDGSEAKAAGLRPGMVLTSINGNRTELSPEGVQQSILALQEQEIHLEWNGGSATLKKKFCVVEE
jgi:hypothetical protein